jgi:hypothetical protein
MSAIISGLRSTGKANPAASALFKGAITMVAAALPLPCVGVPWSLSEDRNWSMAQATLDAFVNSAAESTLIST